MADKIYCGNGNKRNGQYGTFRSVSICLTDLPPEHIFKSEKNGKSYIKLNISDRSEPDQYGKDVTVTVDTWKPDPNKRREQKAPETKTGFYDRAGEGLDDNEDLPF